MREKAKRGGTIGKAPIGYLNVIHRIDGHEARTVEVDDERAPHVVWAFHEFSLGNISLTNLTEQLGERGLRTKQTTRNGAQPLSRTQVHRMLTNPYYTGVVTYEGVEYPGQHTPLVDPETFARIDQLLVDRRASGDRSWKRKHHLRGIIYCGQCGSRLGHGESRSGSGELYDYFFCLGRNKRRTDCDFPYTSVATVEQAVRDLVAEETVTEAEATELRASAVEEVERQTADSRELAVQAERRLAGLTKKRDRLVDAYLADALTIDQLRDKQADINREILDAERIVEGARIATETVYSRLDIIMAIVVQPLRLYDLSDDTGKRLALGALFGGRIDVYEDDESVGGGTGRTRVAAERTEVVAAVRGAVEARRRSGTDGGADDATGGDSVDHGASEAVTSDDGPSGMTNPSRYTDDWGSNVAHMAEDGGFEPPRVLPQHAFQACAIGH